MSKEFFDKLKGNLRQAKSILAFCNKYRAEFLPLKEGYIVAVPRKLDPDAEAEFRALVPEAKQVQFMESPKIQTRMNVDNLIRRAQPQDANIEPDLDHRSITIALGGVPETDPVWGDMSEALKCDGYFDSWKFIINGQETTVIAKMVDVMAKNKAGRTKTINEGDITDLKIGLANAQSIDDILKVMEGS